MTDPDRCGSVACVRRYATAAAIARRVMERTIHVMLVGEREGFSEHPLLADEARRKWEKWHADPRTLDQDRYRGWLPPANVEEQEESAAAESGTRVEPARVHLL